MARPRRAAWTVSRRRAPWRVWPSRGGSRGRRAASCCAFAAVDPNPLQAAALAAAFWKVCSQRAERAAQGRGTFTFRAELLDAASLLDAETFAAEAAPLIAMR